MQESNEPLEQFVLNYLSIHKGGLDTKRRVAISAFLFHDRDNEIKTEWSLLGGDVFPKRDAL